MSPRPDFRPLLRAAAALVAVAIVLVGVLTLPATQTAADRRWSALAAALGAVVALVNFLLVWRLARRLDLLRARAEAASAQQHELLDAMRAAVVPWGSDGRLVTAKRDFRDVRAPIAAHMQPGCASRTRCALPSPPAWCPRPEPRSTRPSRPGAGAS